MGPSGTYIITGWYVTAETLIGEVGIGLGVEIANAH